MRYRRRKKKRSKKSDIEVAKESSALDGQYQQTRVYKIDVEDGSSRMGDIIVTDVTDLSGGTALPLERPLISPTNIGTTANVSISVTTGTTNNEKGAYFGAPILRLLKSAPSAPRYILIPLVYIIVTHWG